MSSKILVIGAATLDRLLYCENYPTANSKSACSTFECGGGNAANTACALGRLLLAANVDMKINLLTKISTDGVGDFLINELESYNVDTSNPLLVRSIGLSSVCTIIVTKNHPYTRTCLFDAGTVGTLDRNDVVSAGEFDELLKGVEHIHSDSRHTEAAASIVKAAKKLNVRISVDVERDRYTQDFDDIIDYADTVFTTEDSLMRPILERRIGYDPFTTCEEDAIEVDEFNFKCVMISYWLQSINTTGNYGIAKEVIVTRGERGSVHVKIEAIESCNILKSSEMNVKRIHSVKIKSESPECIDIVHLVMHRSKISDSNYIGEEKVTYRLTFCGPPKVNEDDVVDTTGAGDSFIGGYIYSSSKLCQSGFGSNNTLFRLKFASWVAGKKIIGNGARTTLPTSEEAIKELGQNFVQLDDKIEKYHR